MIRKVLKNPTIYTDFDVNQINIEGDTAVIVWKLQVVVKCGSEMWYCGSEMWK